MSNSFVVKLDFDPFQIPNAFAKWLTEVSDEEVAKHSSIFAKRAVAARHALVAVAELREAFRLTGDPRIEPMIRDLLEVARDLHDYDPTSD